jgi:hypothetical protein
MSANDLKQSDNFTYRTVFGRVSITVTYINLRIKEPCDVRDEFKRSMSDEKLNSNS